MLKGGYGVLFKIWFWIGYSLTLFSTTSWKMSSGAILFVQSWNCAAACLANILAPLTVLQPRFLANLMSLVSLGL